MSKPANCATEAVRERDSRQAVCRGLDDMYAGRVTAHDVAMRKFRSTIQAASVAGGAPGPKAPRS